MQFLAVLVVIGVGAVSAIRSDVQQLSHGTGNEQALDERLLSDDVKKSSIINDTNILATEGYTVFSGQFSHHAVLFITNDVKSSISITTGSLITPNYILTRAYELRSSRSRYNITEGHVILGTDDGSDGESEQRINFDRNGVQLHPLKDIATIRLKNPVTFTKYVQPIRLPRLSDSRTYERMEGLNVGGHWAPLKYLRNEIITNIECATLHPYEFIGSHHICTNAFVGGAFCKRVHGSGLIVEDSQGPVLVGVTSSIYSCALPYPTIYERVSNVRGWIAMNSDYVFDF